MNRLILCSALVMSACSVNGEIRTTTDPFKGVQRGFALYLDSGHYTAVDMIEAKGEFTMGVLVAQQGVSAVEGKPGDKGQFKVGDQTLTFGNTDEVKPVSNAGYAIFTQWILHFKLTRDQAAAFAAAPLTAVEVSVGGQSFQLQLTPAQAKRFRENMAILTKT